MEEPPIEDVLDEILGGNSYDPLLEEEELINTDDVLIAVKSDSKSVNVNSVNIQVRPCANKVIETVDEESKAKNTESKAVTSKLTNSVVKVVKTVTENKPQNGASNVINPVKDITKPLPANNNVSPPKKIAVAKPMTQSRNANPNLITLTGGDQADDQEDEDEVSQSKRGKFSTTAVDKKVISLRPIVQRSVPDTLDKVVIKKYVPKTANQVNAPIAATLNKISSLSSSSASVNKITNRVKPISKVTSHHAPQKVIRHAASSNNNLMTNNFNSNFNHNTNHLHQQPNDNKPFTPRIHVNPRFRNQFPQRFVADQQAQMGCRPPMSGGVLLPAPQAPPMQNNYHQPPQHPQYMVPQRPVNPMQNQNMPPRFNTPQLHQEPMNNQAHMRPPPPPQNFQHQPHFNGGQPPRPAPPFNNHFAPGNNEFNRPPQPMNRPPMQQNPQFNSYNRVPPPGQMQRPPMPQHQQHPPGQHQQHPQTQHQHQQHPPPQHLQPPHMRHPVPHGGPPPPRFNNMQQRAPRPNRFEPNHSGYGEQAPNNFQQNQGGFMPSAVVPPPMQNQLRHRCLLPTPNRQLNPHAAPFNPRHEFPNGKRKRPMNQGMGYQIAN